MLLSEIIQKTNKFYVRKKSDEIICITELIYPDKVGGYVITVDYNNENETFFLTSSFFDIPMEDKKWTSFETVKDFPDAVEALKNEKIYVLAIVNNLISINKNTGI